MLNFGYRIHATVKKKKKKGHYPRTVRRKQGKKGSKGNWSEFGGSSVRHKVDEKSTGGASCAKWKVLCSLNPVVYACVFIHGTDGNTDGGGHHICLRWHKEGQGGALWCPAPREGEPHRAKTN